MAKKKNYVGMLAAALAFGLVLSGCDSDGNGGGGGNGGAPPMPPAPSGRALLWEFPSFETTGGVTVGFQQSGTPSIAPPFNAPGLPIVVTGRLEPHYAPDMTIPLAVGDVVRVIANFAVTMAHRGNPWNDYATAAPVEGYPGFYLIDHTIVADNILEAPNTGFRIRTGQTTDNFRIYGIRLYR